MKPHIVFVTPYFAPAWSYGGPPKALFNLARELVEKSYRVSVVTTDALDKDRLTFLEENLNGIYVYRFRNFSNFLAYQKKIFYVPRLLAKAKRILLEADYVLFSDLRTIINWQLFRFALKHKKTYGILAYGQVPYGEGLKSVVKKVFDHLWVKDFVLKASHRFCQTRHESQIYQQVFGIEEKKTQLLLLPVSMPKFTITQVNYPSKYDRHKPNRIILFVGRLHWLKGVDLLIETVLPIIRSDVRVKLVIVGRDDGEEEKLTKMIPRNLQKNVVFTGPLYNDAVYTLYKKATCFVFTPRFYEETSLASLEALSFGVPVITVPQADVPFLEDYGAGFVVENEKKTVSDAVKKIINLKFSALKLMRLKAQRLIKERYDVSVVTKQFESYLP